MKENTKDELLKMCKKYKIPDCKNGDNKTTLATKIRNGIRKRGNVCVGDKCPLLVGRVTSEGPKLGIAGPALLPGEKGIKDCKTDEIRNPKTQRCVKLNGKIGKEVLAALQQGVVEPIGPGIPTKFYPIVENCSLGNDWTQKEIIGQGQYGAAYETCRVGNCDYIMKVQKGDPSFEMEVEALSELQGTGIVPKVYAAWYCDGTGYYVMDKLNCDQEKLGFVPVLLKNGESYGFEDKSFQDKFIKRAKEVKNLLDRLLKRGWLHVDIHKGNVCENTKTGKLVLIDFGWAVKKGQKTYPDHPLTKLANWKYPNYTFDDLLNIQNINYYDTWGYGEDIPKDVIKYNNELLKEKRSILKIFLKEKSGGL